MNRAAPDPHAVLVTGGAGFIGSELTAQLVAAGHRVRVLDNLVNGKRTHLDHFSRAQVELIEGDVRDFDQVVRLAREARTVYHLACLGVRHSLHSPAENHDVNATGTLTLLRAAREARVERLVHVSSSEVYGSAERTPMDERHPCEPHTVYGAAKLAGEAYARAFHRTHGTAVTIVRPFNAYGPRCHHEGDAGEAIPKFILRALAGEPLVIFGDGRQTRDFTHVSDTARGIAMAAQSAGAVGRTINLGTGSELSIATLARHIAALAQAPGNGLRSSIQHQAPRPGDVLRLCADPTLARQLLGFEPRVSLADGLARLIDWYRSQALSPAQLLKAEVARAWEAIPLAAASTDPCVCTVSPPAVLAWPR